MGLESFLDRRLPRRRLGQEAAITAVAVATGTLALPNSAEAAPNPNTLPSYELKDFVRLGIKEYYSLYLITQEMQSTFGTSLQFGELFTGFDKPLNPNSPEIRALRDGWGTKTAEETQKEAAIKMDNLEIDSTEPVAKTDLIRKSFKSLAKVLPGLAIMVPSKVTTYAAEPGEFEGSAGDDDIRIANPVLDDYSHLSYITIHEASHYPENMKSLAVAKPYLNKEKTIKFRETQAQATLQTAAEWFSSPWDKAKTYTNGNPLLQIYGYESIETKTDDLLEAARIVDAYFPDSIPSNTVGLKEPYKLNFLYNRIAWAVGRKVMEMSKSNNLDQGSRNFLKDPTLKGLMHAVLLDIGHNFTGPLGSTKGQYIPTGADANQIGELQDPLAFRAMAVQLAKMEAFGVPGKNKIQDIAHAFEINSGPQTETYEKLVKYGAEYIGTREYEAKKRISVYKLPNTSAPDKNYYYIEYIEGGSDSVKGHMLALKKGVILPADFTVTQGKIPTVQISPIIQDGFLIKPSSGYGETFVKKEDGSYEHQQSRLNINQAEAMNISEAPKVVRLGDWYARVAPLVTDASLNPETAKITEWPADQRCLYRLNENQDLELYPFPTDSDSVDTYRQVLSIAGKRRAILFSYNHTDEQDKKSERQAMALDSIIYAALPTRDFNSAGANIIYKGGNTFSIPGVPWNLELSEEHARFMKLELTRTTHRRKYVTLHAGIEHDFSTRGTEFMSAPHNEVFYYLDADFRKIPFVPSLPPDNSNVR